MEEYEFTYNLGNIIKTAREKAGLTQEQLAALADIKSSNTILHIENYHGISAAASVGAKRAPLALSARK